MVLDSKIQKVRDYYGITTWADWQEITPQQVLKLEGVGRVTLDHIRLYLAGHEVALKNDMTPEYWRKNINRSRMAGQVTDDDIVDVAPFTIVIDSAEQEPFSFANIRGDADSRFRPVQVPIVWKSLGRHPNQLGDYSADGFIGRVHIERKSIVDLQGTILDFTSGGRDRFEQELTNLAALESAAVVVEGSLAAVLGHQNDRRKREHRTVAKNLFRSIIALQQDYRVPWFFCDNRALAEQLTYRWIERFVRKDTTSAMDIEALVEAM